MFRQRKNHRFKLHTPLRVSKPEKSCSHLNDQAFFKEREEEGRKEDEEGKKIELYVLSLLTELTEVITPNLPILVGYKMKERGHEIGEARELGRGIDGEYDQN